MDRIEPGRFHQGNKGQVFAVYVQFWRWPPAWRVPLERPWWCGGDRKRLPDKERDNDIQERDRSGTRKRARGCHDIDRRDFDLEQGTSPSQNLRSLNHAVEKLRNALEVCLSLHHRQVKQEHAEETEKEI